MVPDIQAGLPFDERRESVHGRGRRGDPRKGIASTGVADVWDHETQGGSEGRKANAIEWTGSGGNLGGLRGQRGNKARHPSRRFCK